MAKKAPGKSVLPKKLRIKTEQLRWVCDPALIPAKLSSDLKPINGLLGQERALEAVSFGLDIPSAGYNIFVHGDPGSGKHNAIMAFVKQRAATEQQSCDWLYVQNFEVDHKPVALRLPAMQGSVFKATLDSALNAIAEGLPSLLEGDDTKGRQKAIEEEFRQAQETGFEKISKKAEKKGLGISQTAQGFSVLPLNEGTPYTPEEFEQLPKQQKEALQKAMQDIQKLLAEFMSESVPELDKTRQDELKALYDEVTDAMVSHHLQPVIKAFGQDDAITSHLQSLAADLSEHTPLLAQLAAGTLGGEGATISGAGSR